MRRIRLTPLRAGIVLAVALAFVPVAQRTAEASCSTYKEILDNKGKKKKELRMGKPERTFKGRVLTSKKRFATYASSVNKYISKIRKNVQKKFWENKAKKEWKIEFIAFFKRPHDDLEVSIRLWDTTKGNKRMISQFEQMIDRCATSYASDMILKRERFGVNKKILITVEGTRGGGVLASGKFEILGEAEKFSGKVDFSDEEDKKDEVDEDAAAAAAAAKKREQEKDKEEDKPPEDLNKFDVVDEDKDIFSADDKVDDDDPDLDTRNELNGPPEQHKGHGCGCRTSSGGDAAGSLLLIAFVFGLVRRRRGRR